MSLRIAINGLGRMGKLALRAGWTDPALTFVAVNEIKGGPEIAAHLLEFDTVQGRWRHAIGWTDDALTIDGATVAFTDATSPEEIPWTGDDVDLVMECSGTVLTGERLRAYLDKGIGHVLVSAPVKDGSALNLVYGVNHHLFDPAAHPIVTAASCTTNCLAPVVKVIHESLGIVHGSMTTIHDVTNTQVMVDSPHKDKRRARSGLNALIPTTTGSATAITLIYPELEGKLNGHAIRVPLLNASLTDCVFEVARDTTEEAVNDLFRAAAAGPLAGILGVEERPLVSTDFQGDPRSSVIDAPSTMVIDKRQVKIYAWYDNEWGYVNRMIDLAKLIVSART
ncbi:MAG: ArsJ-associated glyceraldehyde-3-phosphate dehydrogenase [Rhodospirillum sp.]|nr:ArsJ-associated glyceraldehyde-3-phosphate dehydrogenase [Rhodospirillum sp.]MCF8489694.1 ArsJ-associated glyceraldehyde-3-phosphate dehydrogenase [Rhodospirillum sp.]MCF8501669.1 ArsJ-associated glyceraldehyde-3-phosphate dehydrogenase [Rhodospirillum sp.]